VEDGKLELGVVDFCTNLPGVSLRSFSAVRPVPLLNKIQLQHGGVTWSLEMPQIIRA